MKFIKSAWKWLMVSYQPSKLKEWPEKKVNLATQDKPKKYVFPTSKQIFKHWWIKPAGTWALLAITMGAADIYSEHSYRFLSHLAAFYGFFIFFVLTIKIAKWSDDLMSENYERERKARNDDAEI